MTAALYAGSFDPVHLGHLDILGQAAACFDRVVAGVLVNQRKPTGMFTPADRARLLVQATEHLPNVTVRTFTGLTVDLARDVDADVLVRGAHKEGRNELQMAAINHEVGAIPTVFFPASPERAAISSSTIRGLTSNGLIDAARELVPACVGEALAAFADGVQASALGTPTE